MVPAHSASNGTLTLRDTIDHRSSDYSTNPVSGASVTIRPQSTILYLGTGDQMEEVRVTGVLPGGAVPGSDPVSSRIQFVPTQNGGKFKFPHYRGETFCTERIGNPGPQKGISIDVINPTSAFRATVVPYADILQ